MSEQRFFLACSSLGALEAADQAVTEYEQRLRDKQPMAAGPEQTGSGGDQQRADGGADTIYRALTWGPLTPSYASMLTAWLELPPGHYLPLDSLAGILRLTVSKVQARFSKLSARLKRVATEAELADHPKTPLGLLVEVAYAADTTSYRLTENGRIAAARYLGR